MYCKVMRSNVKSLQGCFVFSCCFSFFLNRTRFNIPSTRWSTWDISKETATPWVSPRCSSIKFHFCVSFCKKPRATQNISLTTAESLGVKHSYKNKARSDSWHIVAKLYFTAALQNSSPVPDVASLQFVFRKSLVGRFWRFIGHLSVRFPLVSYKLQTNYPAVHHQMIEDVRHKSGKWLTCSDSSKTSSVRCSLRFFNYLMMNMFK